MLSIGILTLLLGAAQTVPPASAPKVVADSVPTRIAVPAFLSIPSDTPPPRARPQVVEISEGYERRLRLHRYLSYSVVPLFAFQYAAGDQLLEKGNDAPAWAKTGHRVGATALAGVFTVNTVTGVWNLWETRAVKEGRALRLTHALSMLVADAGFVWAGGVLSQQAQNDPTGEKRRLHRKVALNSMGLTLASGTMMYVLNR